MVSTYVQPDYTAQSGSTYKAAIDGAAAVHHRLAGPFAPHAQTTPDMTVAVDAGHLWSGSATTDVAAQSSATITAPTTNPRNDLIVIDRSTGAVSVVAGTEAASPVDPAVPAGKHPVGRARLTVGMTEITNADLDDIRATVVPAGTAATKDVGTAANNVVQLDGSAKLPAVDGSQLTGVVAVPIGAIVWHAADSAPTGFLKANGASLSTTTYAALFAVIGYTFGGSGGSFNLPDLRGEFLRGWDDSRGVDSGRSFGSAQSDDFESHTHTGSTASGGAHTHTHVNTGGGAQGSPGTADVFSAIPATTSNAGAHTHTMSLNSTGGSETRPRNVALLACIKY